MNLFLELQNLNCLNIFLRCAYQFDEEMDFCMFTGKRNDFQKTPLIILSTTQFK